MCFSLFIFSLFSIRLFLFYTNYLHIFLNTDLQGFVAAINDMCHHMADCVLHGFATAHAAQIEPGEGK